MNGRKRLITLLLGLGVMSLALVGCNTVYGGGWIVGADGGKATFGFDLNCDQSSSSVSGDLEYVDHSVGLKIHGIPDSTPGSGFGIACSSAFTANGEYYGTYMSQPPVDSGGNPIPGGRFYVNIHDGGTPGSDGDTFYIQLYGGVYDGYSKFGALQGGNVTAE